MSRNVLAHAGVSRDRASWHGAAFVLETMLLVVFIAASLAVLAAVFSGAQMRGIDAIRLTDAVTLATSGASNGAEDFAADPVGAYEEGATTTHYAVAAGSVYECDPSAENACEVTRLVDARDTQAGMLYDATITVTRDGEVLYELATSAYVSDRADTEAGGGVSTGADADTDAGTGTAEAGADADAGADAGTDASADAGADAGDDAADESAAAKGGESDGA